eukprot:sb/3461469/
MVSLPYPGQNDIIELPRETVRAELLRPVSVGRVQYGDDILTRTQLNNWLQSPTGRNEGGFPCLLGLNSLATYSPRTGTGMLMAPTPYWLVLRTSQLPRRRRFNKQSNGILSINKLSENVIQFHYDGRRLLSRGGRLTTNQNPLFRSRDWLSANQGPWENYAPTSSIKLTTNQNPLFRSRDWLSANQGPWEYVSCDAHIYGVVCHVESSTEGVSQEHVTDTEGDSTVHTNSILLIILACVTICLLVCGGVLLYTVKRGSIRFVPILHSPLGSCSTAENPYESPQHIYESVHQVMRKDSVDYYSTIPPYSALNKSPVPSLITLRVLGNYTQRDGVAQLCKMQGDLRSRGVRSNGPFYTLNHQQDLSWREIKLCSESQCRLAVSFFSLSRDGNQIDPRQYPQSVSQSGNSVTYLVTFLEGSGPVLFVVCSTGGLSQEPHTLHLIWVVGPVLGYPPRRTPSWHLAMNINPADGHIFGFTEGWATGTQIGTKNNSLTMDYLDHFVWMEPANYIAIHITALASAKVTTTSPQPRVPESSNTRYFTKFIIIFDAKRHKIDTSRLLHSKDNRVNCVVEWFLFSSGQRCQFDNKSGHLSSQLISVSFWHNLIYIYYYYYISLPTTIPSLLYSGRRVVSDGGPIQVEIAHDAKNIPTDPIFGVGGELAFNWRYTENGHRIVLTGGHLSEEDSTDSNTRGLGNDIYCNPLTGETLANGAGAFDISVIQDCPFPICTSYQLMGTDQRSPARLKNGPVFGNYAIYIAEDSSWFPGPGEELQGVVSPYKIWAETRYLGHVDWLSANQGPVFPDSVGIEVTPDNSTLLVSEGALYRITRICIKTGEVIGHLPGPSLGSVDNIRRSGTGEYWFGLSAGWVYKTDNSGNLMLVLEIPTVDTRAFSEVLHWDKGTSFSYEVTPIILPCCAVCPFAARKRSDSLVSRVTDYGHLKQLFVCEWISRTRKRGSFLIRSDNLKQEPIETSKQPIINRYLGHVTGADKNSIQNSKYIKEMAYPIQPALWLARSINNCLRNSLFKSRDWLSANQGPVLILLYLRAFRLDLTTQAVQREAHHGESFWKM